MQNLVVNFFGEFNPMLVKDIKAILKEEGFKVARCGPTFGPWGEPMQFQNLETVFSYLNEFEKRADKHIVLNTHPLLFCDYYNRIGDIDKEWRTIVRTIFSEYNNLNILLDRKGNLKIGAYLDSYGYLYTRFNLDETNAVQNLIKLIKERAKS